MGNNNIIDKYNKSGNVDIYVYLEKVCYFPGENMIGNIKLVPKPGFFQESKNHSQLVITLTQHSHYLYPVGSDMEVDEEILILMTHKFSFSDFINYENEVEMILPINYTIPTHARPSIFIDKSDYVKHTICIEYPYFDVKRTLIFVVKNHLLYNSRNRSLLSPFYYPTIFNKKKFFSKKGYCQLVINMPRNFFQYNERVGYNIHLDCTSLDLPAYKIKVTFCRTRKQNYSSDITRTRNTRNEQLYFKQYNLDKQKKLFNVVDYILFSDPLINRGDCKSPSITYQEMNAHGPYEINDSSLFNSLPSCSEGLLVIEYYLKVKVYFDTIFTSDEQVSAPLDFCDIIDYNLPNVNQMNPNNNNINNEYVINEVSNLNNYDTNIINNNINDNNNIINNNSAPPIAQNNNIDAKKNYLEDKEGVNLDDWIIIDKKKK